MKDSKKHFLISHNTLARFYFTFYIFTALQVDLAVQIHRQIGSRFLIDSLHRQGFCISYDEVLNYERSAASSGMSLPLVISENDFFMQAIADNVDHNMQTIDGKNTFHGMGIIVAVTPRVDSTIAVKKKTQKYHQKNWSS